MPPVRFEPTISADERPKTYALDSAATGTGEMLHIYIEKCAGDKLAAVIQIQTLDNNQQGQHSVRMQAAARGVKSSSLLCCATQSLLVIKNFYLRTFRDNLSVPFFRIKQT
jgi:hypothetical protein